jgi:hypothetical protein
MHGTETVLITGGSGLIGRHVSILLAQNGFNVIMFSRNPDASSRFRKYKWDIEHGELDPEPLRQADYIIHVAGASIAGRWTSKAKKEIVDSRVKSAALIFEKLQSMQHRVKAFISASAVGYYGAVTSQHIFSETDPPGDDFLADVCMQWEAAADRFSAGTRIVKLRTAVVLAAEEGALPQLMLPVKLGIGSPLGGGRQYMPWIHIADLCRIYLHAVRSSISGTFNATAPDHRTNGEFMFALASALHRPFWFPNVPGWMMKLAFGEMSSMLLQGSRVSAEKITGTGFDFRFARLEDALADVTKK